MAEGTPGLGQGCTLASNKNNRLFSALKDHGNGLENVVFLFYLIMRFGFTISSGRCCDFERSSRKYLFFPSFYSFSSAKLIFMLPRALDGCPKRARESLSCSLLLPPFLGKAVA